MDWKKRWTALAEFLGQALGSDYEIDVYKRQHPSRSARE